MSVTTSVGSSGASGSQPELAGAAAPEQTRACYPGAEGYVERNGVRVFYEVYGEGDPTVLLLPTWEIVHSRAWKCQIPYFARHGRVVTFDRRGNGRSDRPLDVRAYDRCESVGDALAVLDRVGVERVVVVSWCGAGDEGWAKWNRHYWLRDWPGFLEFFFTQTFTEPHSTKQIEDAIGWGLQTDPETIIRGIESEWANGRELALRLCGQVQCPTLVIQGSEDAVVGGARGAAVAHQARPRPARRGDRQRAPQASS